MKSWIDYFTNKKIRIVDDSNPTKLGTAMSSFAIDDTLCETIGKMSDKVAVRFWVHSKTIVLGILDSRLPNVQEGISFLRSQGYDVVLRNSGGLAVVLDDDILNFSFILPDSEALGIHTGYEIMTSFIQEMYSDVTNEIEAYEIVGSYCPGDYDLSIGGKKFAGISQRRVKKGIAVQIYLCMERSGSKRAELIREFYQRADAEASERFDFPDIVPDTMQSLSELLGTTLSVKDAMQRVRRLLHNASDHVYEQELSEEELPIFENRMTQMIDRNKKIMEMKEQDE